jgi:hypothetical protein
MTKQHTPGPWTIKADPDKAGLHPLHDNRYVTSKRGLVCALRDQPAQAADARLIAAAPELLHALKWAAEYVSLYTPDGAGWTGVQQGHDRGRFIDDATGFDAARLRAFLAETIAKAEGGE